MTCSRSRCLKTANERNSRLATNCSRRRRRGGRLFWWNVRPRGRADSFSSGENISLTQLTRKVLFSINQKARSESGPRATIEMSAVRDCSLILFCVKANDTSATARQMAPFVRPDATVVCLQNGVDNADQVRAAANVVGGTSRGLCRGVGTRTRSREASRTW